MPASEPEEVPPVVDPLDVPDEVPVPDDVPDDVPDAVPELVALTPEDDAPFPLEVPLVPDPELVLPEFPVVPLVDPDAVPPSSEEFDGDEELLEHPYTIVLASER
jgi:hypothetical protein